MRSIVTLVRLRWARGVAVATALRHSATVPPPATDGSAKENAAHASPQTAAPSESQPSSPSSSGPTSPTTPPPTTASFAASAAETLQRVVKERDFQAAQLLLHEHWREEYFLVVISCALLFMVYYTSSSSVRSTQRRCEAMELKVREELTQLKDTMTQMTERWEKEIIQRELQIMEVQRQNMDLATTVDQMTTALKQCGIRAL